MGFMRNKIKCFDDNWEENDAGVGIIIYKCKRP